MPQTLHFVQPESVQFVKSAAKKIEGRHRRPSPEAQNSITPTLLFAPPLSFHLQGDLPLILYTSPQLSDRYNG